MVKINDDNSLSTVGHCTLCGRMFTVNEVQEGGVFIEYFLLHQGKSSCPTCFGEQLHRMKDPSLDDVLECEKFCDQRPSQLLDSASVWDDVPAQDTPSKDWFRNN